MKTDLQEIWLERDSGPVWVFTWNERHGLFTHETRSRTLYAIFSGLPLSKPFWVGRHGRNRWVTCEAELRARRLRFFPTHGLFEFDARKLD